MSIFDENKIYDSIVVGAGPAGCVLANRLSEDSHRHILLIEAGPDAMVPGAEHPDLLDPFAPTASSNPAFHWPNLVAETDADPGTGVVRAMRPYVQGYGVGGASNINGMGADRGQPGDYDEWRDLGAVGWSWEDVLPYFKRLEHDLDFCGSHTQSMHGDNGPMPVRRLPRSRWAPFAAAIGDALHRRGFEFLEDYNTQFGDGFSSTPTNCLPLKRVSASMAYLTLAVRRRANLTILADAKVERISLEGRCANGVSVSAHGVSKRVRGHEVILSCGAIQTPALLMRSGVGLAKSLAQLGIEPVHNLRGVGANLQNHPYVSMVTYLPGGSAQPADNLWFLQNWLRFSSKYPQCALNDMHLMPFNKCAWHKLGEHVGAVVLSVFKPYSKGRVALSNADPNTAPKIQFNLLSDPRDAARLVSGLRFVLELLTDPAVAKRRAEIFLPNGRLVASLNRHSLWNRFRAWATMLVLEHRQLRSKLLANSLIDPEGLLADERALLDFVLCNAQPQYHVCGTCRMGRADDAEAVVGSGGRVQGMGGLRVADASIFPTIPRANTHFTVLMAAEKIADAVKLEWRTAGSVATLLQSRK